MKPFSLWYKPELLVLAATKSSTTTWYSLGRLNTWTKDEGLQRTKGTQVYDQDFKEDDELQANRVLEVLLIVRNPNLIYFKKFVFIKRIIVYGRSESASL